MQSPFVLRDIIMQSPFIYYLLYEDEYVPKFSYLNKCNFNQQFECWLAIDPNLIIFGRKEKKIWVKHIAYCPNLIIIIFTNFCNVFNLKKDFNLTCSRVIGTRWCNWELEIGTIELRHSGACVVTIAQIKSKFQNPIFEGSKPDTGGAL